MRHDTLAERFAIACTAVTDCGPDAIYVDVTATWSEAELEPFETLIGSGLSDAVMTGHIVHDTIDPGVPASLSVASIDGLLRGRLGWAGAVITDDLEAIVSRYSRDEAWRWPSRRAMTSCSVRPSSEPDSSWQEYAYTVAVRASRLVTLLLLLQSRGQLTAGELAEELEVSERTIHRDVDALSQSGVPIYAERGPHGGIRLVDGYRTRLTGMTPDEAEALFLAGLPGPAAELGLGTVVAAAQLKVLASLPPELRARASRLVERFHLDAGDWFHASQPVPHLAALSDAVWSGARIAIDYERGDGPVRRVLEPLGVVLKGGIWYVVARVADQIRTYRVSRVVATEPTTERFERPDGFDLAAYWAESAAAFERDAPRIEVVVRVHPDRVDQLRTAVGGAVMNAAERLPDEHPDGWLGLRLRLDWPEEAAGVLLRAGPWIDVVSPPEIRTGVATMAREVAARYANG